MSIRFSMRPIDETIEDIKQQAELYRGKKITSCFLQDGDALVLKTDYLLRILDAINQYIRVNATGIKPESKMGEFVRDGSFTLQSEEEIVIEQKLFLQQLQEMDSCYMNEHIINLLLEVRGNLWAQKKEMLSTIDRFLTLPPHERLLFAVGRRLNIFFFLDDLKKPELHQKAEESLKKILDRNPDVDFTALCNYVRQSQI